MPRYGMDSPIPEAMSNRHPFVENAQENAKGLINGMNEYSESLKDERGRALELIEAHEGAVMVLRETVNRITHFLQDGPTESVVAKSYEH
jgi:hypothetical protein